MGGGDNKIKNYGGGGGGGGNGLRIELPTFSLVILWCFLCPHDDGLQQQSGSLFPYSGQNKKRKGITMKITVN